MAKAIIKVILSVLQSIVNIITAPINVLIDTFIPNLSETMTNLNGFLSNYIYSPLAWFSSLFPPLTKAFLLIIIGSVVAFYSIYWTYTAIQKMMALLQRLKLW